MLRTIKLTIYFFLYQALFSMLFLWVECDWDFIRLINTMKTGQAIVPSVTNLSLSVILSGIAMIWHLIHFKYVKFNLKSFSEVPSKTIWLSIPFIVSSMVFINLCSEFLNLSDNMQDIFRSMSRNLLGILSITIMAPLVEELLFRGAIQGHLLRIGMKPLYAILVSSLVFGVVHGNPIQIPFAFSFGLILGWLYYRTGNLAISIIGHFINNSIACIQMATLTEEEFNTKTIEWLGEGPTYAIFALAFVVMMGMFLYLKKHLPDTPSYTEQQETTI